MTITADDNLTTIGDFQRELKDAGFTVSLSQLAAMQPEQREAMRKWLDDENAVDIPEPFDRYVTEEPDGPDEPEATTCDACGELKSRLELHEHDNVLMCGDCLQSEQPATDPEDAARKLKEIRDAEREVCAAESVVDDAKDELKAAKTAYEAAVLRLRGVIQSHSSPQKQFPFRDEADAESNGAAPAPPDPAGDEPLTVLGTKTLRLKTGNNSVEGLTPKKVEALAEACGGQTIASLEKWFRENPHWNTDLPGFGEEWITRLQDAHLAFRQAFPIPTEELAEEPAEEPEPASVEDQAGTDPESPADSSF